ncbi:LysR family transcriptional regulator, partial [Streptomyces sp. NPDC004976]
MGTSPQGVTRAIQQLEQHYGEVLFHRSTRQVRITAFG